jgi:hypothetical protein
MSYNNRGEGKNVPWVEGKIEVEEIQSAVWKLQVWGIKLRSLLTTKNGRKNKREQVKRRIEFAF